MPRRRRKLRKNPDFSKSKKRRASAGRWRDRGGRALGHERDERGQRRVASRIRKRVAARRARRVAHRNPAAILAGVDWVETGKLVGVAFGGFAAGRLMTRIVAVQVAKRKPTWAKHAGVAANAAAFAAALFLSKRWKRSAPYEWPLVVGTGLSLLQTFVQTYFPKLGWIVADATPDQIAEAAGQNQLPAPQTSGMLPDDDGDVDDGDDWSSYNDAYDQGRFSRSAQPQNQPARPQPQARPVDVPSGVHQEGGGIDDGEIDDALNNLDDNSDLYTATN